MKSLILTAVLLTLTPYSICSRTYPYSLLWWLTCDWVETLTQEWLIWSSCGGLELVNASLLSTMALSPGEANVSAGPTRKWRTLTNTVLVDAPTSPTTGVATRASSQLMLTQVSPLLHCSSASLLLSPTCSTSSSYCSRYSFSCSPSQTASMPLLQTTPNGLYKVLTNLINSEVPSKTNLMLSFSVYRIG